MDSEDPLAVLDELVLDHPSYEAVAQLLLVERLIGKHGVSAITSAEIGPPVHGRRAIQLAWISRKRYANEEPWAYEMRGERASGGR